MSDVVRAEYKYNGLNLICDQATVNRMHDLLRAELAVVIPKPDDEVRSVAVWVEKPMAPHPWKWSFLFVGVWFGFTMLISGTIVVAAFIKIAEWISAWLS